MDLAFLSNLPETMKYNNYNYFSSSYNNNFTNKLAVTGYIIT